MTREQYIQILENRESNPNLMLQVIDSYLMDKNLSFNFVHFYNIISQYAGSIDGMMSGINPQMYFMIACDKAMTYYNEKFVVQPYRLDISNCSNLKVVKNFQNKYQRNYLDIYV
jgi:hypothetical protein